MELWTEKYKPRQLAEIAGHHKTIALVSAWLDAWKPGTALLLHGKPGIGKTLLAEVIAADRRWELLELNASDARTAEQMEAMTECARARSLAGKGKLILIDEVDGVAGSDRGGVGAIVRLIRSSSYPVVLTANDPWNKKLLPLRGQCELVKMPAVPVPSIAKRLREICAHEGIAVPDDILKSVARWSQGDMRSAITDLQLVATGKQRVQESDLEILGYRDRESDMFSVLPALFNARSISAAKKMVQNLNRDPDELFWWIEHNLEKVTASPAGRARGYDLLAHADLLRARVMKQQNWRFRLYMLDLLCSIGVVKGEGRHGFIPFQPPQRFLQLARTKTRREEQKGVEKKIGAYAHCSVRLVRQAYLPYFRLMVKKKAQGGIGLELAPEEIKILVRK